ncbi:MAG: hypothetical protein KBG15_14270 [Kofleriaceae bacterium]|nr:hypothetical protein [Kofleriaceae bacterium]
MESLTVYDIVDSLVPLRGLAKLRTLSRSGVRRAELKPLAQLEALESLSLRGPVKTLEPIAKLTKVSKRCSVARRCLA